jgi:ammonia channel protein AmtB
MSEPEGHWRSDSNIRTQATAPGRQQLYRGGEIPDEGTGLLEGEPHLLLIQLYGVVVTLGLTALVTYVLLKLVSLFVRLRVSLQQELEGLDISQQGEALQ